MFDADLEGRARRRRAWLWPLLLVGCSAETSGPTDAEVVEAAADEPSTIDVFTTDLPSVDAPVEDVAPIDAPVEDVAPIDDPVPDVPSIDAPVTDLEFAVDAGALDEDRPPAEDLSVTEVAAALDVGVEPQDIPRETSFDAPSDAGTMQDIPLDLPVDRGVDVPLDLPVDRGVDVPLDLSVDRGVDVPLDLPVDRGVDVPLDLPVDRGVDVPLDLPVDRGGSDASPNDPVAYSGTFAARTGRFQATQTLLGEARVVELAVPSRAVSSPPLLLVFHGTNSDGVVAMTDANAQVLADREGVVVAAPSSRFLPVGDFDHATAETYWETAPNADPDANRDVLLARAIVVEARRAYAIDPARVYVLGHSSGGFFAEFLAALLSDRIAAFSANSAGLVRCAHTLDCTFTGPGTTCAALRLQPGYCSCAGPELPAAVPAAGRLPPALLTHGSGDPLVSVYYSCTLAETMAARGSTAAVQIIEGAGHMVPPNWTDLVWPFFAPRRLGVR